MTMIPIRARREQLGLSQRELAAKSGVAFRTVQLMDGGRHDPRWSTLRRLAAVLGRPGESMDEAVGRCFLPAGDTAAEASAAIARDGEDSWRLWLFNLVDAFRRAPAPELVAQPPCARASIRVRALLASTVECLCAERGMRPPAWCAGVLPLGAPWFVAGVENLKALALAESPAQFRRRNIFVLGSFLARA